MSSQRDGWWWVRGSSLFEGGNLRAHLHLCFAFPSTYNKQAQKHLRTHIRTQAYMFTSQRVDLGECAGHQSHLLSERWEAKAAKKSHRRWTLHTGTPYGNSGH